MVLLSIILPVVAGFVMILIPEGTFRDRGHLLKVTGVLFVTCAMAASYVVCTADGEGLVLFRLVDEIPLYFAVDGLGRLFAATVTAIFLVAGFYSFAYMAHEKNEKRYYGFYLVTFGVLMGLCFSGNLLTMYMFYEFMTLAATPLVIHTCTKEAVMASLKYVFYSFGGAYMALFGIYFLYKYALGYEHFGASFATAYETETVVAFVPGGFVDYEAIQASGNAGLFLAASFLMILGFGVKAGCFPLHAWLPAAHPVAPAPASAFLSGIIVKGGVFALIRAVYYSIGAEHLRGTWVQSAWFALAAVTLLMGSVLAFKEKILKKRLAYSTVSNLSYILLGLSMMNATSFAGSLLHLVFHAFIKSGLFLFAGALIFSTQKTRVGDFAGLGRRMPILFWSYTVCSLGLIGIPPTSGLVSKFYLASGCLEGGMGGFSWLGAAALMVSALLTAGYLLPIAIRGFLLCTRAHNEISCYRNMRPARRAGGDKSSLLDCTKAHNEISGEAELEKYGEPAPVMLVPVALCAAATLAFGIYPVPLVRFVKGIADMLIQNGGMGI